MGNTTVNSSATRDLTTTDIKIPVYQRKGGKWDEKKGEKKILFCVSLLLDYPIGSVVLHAGEQGHEQFLMDGQQRRETVMEISKIRPFLKRLDEYFTTDVDIFEERLKVMLLEKFYEVGKSEDYDGDFSPISRDGIQLLVKLRKCYGRRTKKSGSPIYPLEKIHTHNRIKGNPLVWQEDERFKGEELAKKMIESYDDDNLKEADLETEEGRMSFAARYMDIMGINSFKGTDQTKQDKSKSVVTKHFATKAKEIIEAIQVMYRFHQQTMSAKIGQITFTSNSQEEIEYDLQTIFRLINDKGVPLERIEILAAVPRWSGTTAQVELEEGAKILIGPTIAKLKSSSNTPTTKYHICGGFAIALDELNKNLEDPFKRMDLLIENFEQKDEVKAMEDGFRLMSLFSNHTVQDKSWLNLYQEGKDDPLFTQLQPLQDFVEILQILGDDPYFKQMRRWGWPIISKLGGTNRLGRDSQFMLAALLILYRRVSGLKHNSSETKIKKFTLPARRLFDYFVFHRVGGLLIGPGGADEKLKSLLDDLKADNGINLTVTEEDWKKLLTNAIDHGLAHNELDYTQSDKAPKEGTWPKFARLWLAHMYTMRANDAELGSFFAAENTNYHVDHIVPKELWQDWHSGTQSKHSCHNLGNLMLLDDKANTNKRDKLLKQVVDEPTINKIVKWGGIPRDQFDSLSEVNHEAIVEVRKNFLITKFLEARKKCLTKGGKWWT